LVSLDGTTYFSSKTIHCPNCLTRQLANGQTLSYHPAITPVIVCPGRPAVLALPPEYIMPQDGQAKQDCEQRAGKRWISKHAKVVAPHQVTLLGDDLYSKQPFCALALQQGFSNSHFGSLRGKQPQSRVVTVPEFPGSAAILAAFGAGETPALPGKSAPRCDVGRVPLQNENC